jgi:Domain of unknown function (DUF4261)
MARGMFTQCLTVLFKEAPPIEALAEALSGFAVHGVHAATNHWALGGPSVSLMFNPDANGLALVDTVDQRWPDDMGDPQKQQAIFGAWTTGNFGPLTDPGGLGRAMQQCWVWKEGRTVAAEHRGFVRVRSSYALGTGEDVPLIPADWNAVTELAYLTTVVEALLQMPGALCYFNPSGEVLRDLAGVRAHIEQAKGDDLLLLDLWANVRAYPYDVDWTLMDTVGNGQLNDVKDVGSEVRDVEAVFRTKVYDRSEVGDFLRDLSVYLHDEGDVVKDGDHFDGPGNVKWKTSLTEQSVAMPLRRVLHVVADDGVEPPAKPA